MLEGCIAPLVMVGVMSGVETSWHHHQVNPGGEVLEVQSCQYGPGLAVTAAPSSGLYGIAAQWGFQVASWGDLRVYLKPQVGISHDTYGYRELPLGTQFEVGGMVNVEYDNANIGVKYWHLSNAGIKQPNIGMDILAVMGGFRF